MRPMRERSLDAKVVGQARDLSDGTAAPFAVASLHRLHETLPDVPLDHQPVGQHEELFGEVQGQESFCIGKLDDLLVLIEAVESVLAQVEQDLSDDFAFRRFGGFRLLFSFGRRTLQFQMLPVGGKRKENVEPRALGQGKQSCTTSSGMSFLISWPHCQQ